MYCKIFQSILKSSVWIGSSKDVKILWITMLCQKDNSGLVQSTVPGLAKDAELTIEECEKALKVLSSPDIYSGDQVRNPDSDGRRIERVPGGWKILNHQYYRNITSIDDQKEKWREQKRRQRGQQRTQVDMSAMSAYTDTDPNNRDLPDSSLRSESGYINNNIPSSDPLLATMPLTLETDKEQAKDKNKKKKSNSKYPDGYGVPITNPYATGNKTVKEIKQE